MRSAQDVVNKDLEYICSNLREESACLSGKRLLITGGAGFLGYYLVQSVLHWNKKTDRAQSIQLTVYDNYIRGVPAWLTKLEGDRNLTLVEHDITNPLPQDMGDFQYIIHAASIASPTYYRKYPVETMDFSWNIVESKTKRVNRLKVFCSFLAAKSMVIPPLKISPHRRVAVAMSLVQGHVPVMMSQNVTVKPCV